MQEYEKASAVNLQARQGRGRGADLESFFVKREMEGILGGGRICHKILLLL